MTENVYLIKASDFLICVSVYTKLDRRNSNSWLQAGLA